MFIPSVSNLDISFDDVVVSKLSGFVFKGEGHFDISEEVSQVQ